MKILLFIVVGVAIYLFVYGGTGRVGGSMSPPVGVTYRDSYVGAGIVMDIANHSGKTLYGVRVHIVGRDGRSTDAKVATALNQGRTRKSVGCSWTVGSWRTVRRFPFTPTATPRRFAPVV